MWGGSSREMKTLLFFYSVKFLASCHNLTHIRIRFSVASLYHSNVLSGLADTFLKKMIFEQKAYSFTFLPLKTTSEGRLE